MFQGVVSGVLLVTPNAVMFDPNVSDTLVMEHGPESYGVIAPMEYVVNAAIFYDIAHMRTHGPDHSIHKYVPFSFSLARTEKTDGLVGEPPTSDPKVVGSNPGRVSIDFSSRKRYVRIVTCFQKVKENNIIERKIQIN